MSEGLTVASLTFLLLTMLIMFNSVAELTNCKAPTITIDKNANFDLLNAPGILWTILGQVWSFISVPFSGCLSNELSFINIVILLPIGLSWLYYLLTIVKDLIPFT